MSSYGLYLIQEYPNKEFDETDIYQKEIPREYSSLHDPLLSHYRWGPEVYEHLIGQKLITPDGRVKCSLKELNEYRDYLHRIWAMEANQLRREQVAEVKEMLQILRKIEPTQEEKITLETLAQKHRLLDQSSQDDLRGQIQQKLYRGTEEYLENPTEDMSLAEKRLRAKKRAIKAQNRNLKELDDWLYEQSQFLRTYDASNYAKKKARDDRLIGRWQTHNIESELWAEEERRLREQNEIDRLRGQEERDRQVQQHRDRQKKGPLASSPRTSRVGETPDELERFFARQEEEEEVAEERIGDELREAKLIIIEPETEYPEKREYSVFEPPPSVVITTRDLLPSTDTTKEEVEPPELPVCERKSEAFAVGTISEYKPGEESGCYDSYVDTRVSRSTAAFMDALVSGIFDEIEGVSVSAEEKRILLPPEFPKEALEIHKYEPGEETEYYSGYVDSKVTRSTAGFMDALVSGVFNAIEGESKQKPVELTDTQESDTVPLADTTKDILTVPLADTTKDILTVPPADTTNDIPQIQDYKPGEETGRYSSYVDNKVTRSTTAFVDAMVSGVYNAVEGKSDERSAESDIILRLEESRTSQVKEIMAPPPPPPQKESLTEGNKSSTPALDESSITQVDKNYITEQDKSSTPATGEDTIPQLDRNDIPQKDKSSIANQDGTSISHPGKSIVPQLDNEQRLENSAISKSEELVDNNVVTSVEYQSAEDTSTVTSDIPRAVSQSYQEEIYESTPEDRTEQNVVPGDSPVREDEIYQEAESEQFSELRSGNSDATEPQNMHSSKQFYDDIC